jgi:cold shock CspA family protein
MLWFNEVKGHGLIEADTGERVQVYRSAFADGGPPVGRCKGLPVQFTAAEGPGGWAAATVALIPEVDRRRTTRHHGARVL